MKSSKRRRVGHREISPEMSFGERLEQLDADAVGGTSGPRRMGSREDFENFCKSSLTTWPVPPEDGDTMKAQARAYRAFFKELIVYMDIMQAQVVPASLVREMVLGVASHMLQANKVIRRAEGDMQGLLDAVQTTRRTSKSLCRSVVSGWTNRTSETVRDLDLLSDEEEATVEDL